MDKSPEPAERGRYAVYPQDPTGLVIARTAGLCERCASCGCGEPQEPIDLTPKGVGKLLGSKRAQGLARIMMPGVKV